MYLLAPANASQLAQRVIWFKNPIARKLADKKGVEFGFELKGKPQTINPSVGGMPLLFWGYHLPENFATEWYYHPEKRQKLLADISHIPSLRPVYINMHGIHLWTDPPVKGYPQRYINHSEPEEYLKISKANIELIKQLKVIFKNTRLTLENYTPFEFYQQDNRILPLTHLYTGTGRLNDILYLKEKSGIDILLDLEHLILTLNFLNRTKNYAALPVEKVQNLNRDLLEIFGFVLEKDVIPYSFKKVKLEDMIRKIGAKNYHVTGSTQDVIPGKKILTHGPIKMGDNVFRQNLRLILNEKPETILVETASQEDNPCYHYLRPNETELSFYQLCEILLEEL